MLWTKSGYSNSVIFSLFAKSRARSKGILQDEMSNYKIKHQACTERTYQTPLRCMGPILTTCRTFSLFRIPSRRPRVIPATFSSFVPLIMWLSSPHALVPSTLLSSRGDKITFSPGDTNTARLHLEAEASLVLPERSGDSWLHARRRNLACLVESMILVLHALLNSRERQNIRSLGHAIGHGGSARGRRCQTAAVAILIR